MKLITHIAKPIIIAIALTAALIALHAGCSYTLGNPLYGSLTANIIILVLVGGYLLIKNKRHPHPHKPRTTEPPTAGWWWVAGITGILLVPVIQGIAASLSRYAQNNNGDEVTNALSSPTIAPTLTNLFLVLLLSTLLAPIVEELVFREVIYSALQPALPWYLVVFNTAFLFAVAHGSIEQFIIIIPLGIYLSLVRHATQKTSITIALHIAYNVSVYTVTFAMRELNNTVLKDTMFDNIIPDGQLYLLTAVGVIFILLGFGCMVALQPRYTSVAQAINATIAARSKSNSPQPRQDHDPLDKQDHDADTV